MIFNLKDNDTVVINMVEFIDKQMKINEHFPNPNRDRKLVDVFDSMVGQIEEEIYETKEAVYNNKKRSYYTAQDENSLEEFIDAFMYTGSLICEMLLYLNVDYKEHFKQNKIEKIIIVNRIKDSFEKEKFYKLDDSFLACLRRNIYNRKYHKPASEEPKNFANDFICKIVYQSYLPNKFELKKMGVYKGVAEKYGLPEFLGNFNNYLQSVLFCYDNGFVRTDDDRIRNMPCRINLLNEIINKKQEFITNL